MNLARLTPTLALLLVLTGCRSTSGPNEIAITPGQYSIAFAAARDVLRDERWIVERVDSRAGVITTQETYTSSATAPGDRQLASTLSAPADAINRQQRIIRITFEPETPAGAPSDLADYSGPMVMRVRATVLRVQSPGWRVPNNSVRYASRSIDQDLVARNLQPDYAVPIDEDDVTSSRLASLIAARLNAHSAPTGETEPKP